MSARSVCSGSRPCKYHSLRAISAPFKRPATRTLIPLHPKRRAESTALRMARRNATRFSSCSAIDSATSCASSSGRWTSWMSMCTSRFVRFWISPLSLSISAPLRPMMLPGRAVNRRITSLLAARSISLELIDVERCSRVLGLALRVGNSAAQHFLHVTRRALLGEAQNLQGVFGALPPDQVHHQADLLGGHAHVLRHRYRFNRRSLYRFVGHELGSLRR